jgi:hypothetical protein
LLPLPSTIASRADVTLDAAAETATFTRQAEPPNSQLSRRPKQLQAGRVMAGRAHEVIAISADLKTRALPAVEAWIRERK